MKKRPRRSEAPNSSLLLHGRRRSVSPPGDGGANTLRCRPGWPSGLARVTGRLAHPAALLQLADLLRAQDYPELLMWQVHVTTAALAACACPQAF